MKKLMLAVIVLCSTVQAFELDVTLYQGFYTTHLGMDNTQFNNNNNVQIAKINGYLAGTMTNSYGDKGGFIGYQWNLYSNDKLSLQGGIVRVSGYKRFSMPFLESRDFEHSQQPVNVLLPVFSAAYQIGGGFALQVNNMAGVVLNAGISYNFSIN